VNSRAPDPIDLFIARRLKARRKELRWSMQQLAEKLGLSVQQVQKYEAGVNRISAGRLYEMARVMRVPFTYFVEGFAALNRSAGMHEDEAYYDAGLPQADAAAPDGDAETLLEAFAGIWDEDVRRAILTLAVAWTSRSPAEGPDGAWNP
jgi:transcriptional regulator with XRE-family HTH domain